MKIKQYRRTVDAVETTPLTLKGLAVFLGFGRTKLWSDIKRGYVPEFGDRSTARHYRTWLRANPKVRKKQEKKSEMGRELSRLN